MANIFISYGDSNYKKSLKRLKKEAKEVGLFDKIICFTPKDLPICIKSSPLFLFKKGGGYWIWKPFIIYNTLLHCQDGDVIYYADAGCSLNPISNEWREFHNAMQTYNALFFQYRSDTKYAWEPYCTYTENNSPKLIHWIKPSAIDYFTSFLGSQDYLQYNKIWAGAIILKKTKEVSDFIYQWLSISLFHPELICDPFGEEISRIPKSFNAHRHDQAIITPLIFYYKNKENFLVLPETSESNQKKAAIIASRRVIWTWNIINRIMFFITNVIKKMNICQKKWYN